MFRFTIRELVLVTVIVAIGTGWWLDKRPNPGVTTYGYTHHGFVNGKAVRMVTEIRSWLEPEISN